MNALVTRKQLLIVFDVIVLLLCIAGIEQSRQKSWLHATIEPREGAITMDSVGMVEEAEQILQPGDILVSVAGHPLREAGDLEQLFDRFPKGDTISITFRRNGMLRESSYTLGAFYSVFDLITQALGVFIFFVLAVFVIRQRPQGKEALLFHQLAITVAAVIAFTNGYYRMEPYGIGHLLRALYPSTNLFIGVLVLHFSLVFPRPLKVWPAFLVFLYGAGAVVSAVAAYASLQATLPSALSEAMASVTLYHDTLRISKLVMVLGAVAGIGVFVVRFRTHRDVIIRKQIAWVVIGVGVSVFVYAVFWLLTTSPYPHVLQMPSHVHRVLDFMRIDESMLILSLVLTGSFMAFGIIRYRFFDIEYFFRRSTIYGLVFLFLILVFTGILYGVYRLTGQLPGPYSLAAAVAALIVDLLLFIPTRDLVEKILDRWFFRVEYDFRTGLKSLTTRISEAMDAQEVANQVVDGIDALMHLHGVMVMTVHGKRELRVLARSGFPRWRYPAITVHERRLRALPRKPLLLTDVAEAGADVREIKMPFAVRYGVSLIYTLRAEDETVLGLLVLGSKRSETTFTIEDLDLLHSVSVQAGLHLERLRLQENLLMEKEEAEKLRELSQMKSYFVSGVSHDLKTPLTSIKLFAELLEQQIPEDDAGGHRYVSVIQGECDRLARMINNVLDFTKIERGMMKYSFAPVDVNALVRQAYDVMEYQFAMGGFQCEVSLCEEGGIVEGDADALLEALTNVLANAMKYSGNGRNIHLRTRCANGTVAIEVEDHGLGIHPDDIPHLFEPFYRSQNGDVQKHGGVGLGLALVKHIIDAHHGRIDVRSIPGEGSTFTISLHSEEDA